MKSEERKTTLRDTFRQRLAETDRLEAAVSILLKGKEYTLEFNNLSVKGVLKTLELHLIRDGLTKADLTDLDHLGGLLYWGLHEHHPELTPDDVDRLITQRHYMYIVDKLRVSLSLFMPDMSDFPSPDEVQEAEPHESDPT